MSQNNLEGPNFLYQLTQSHSSLDIKANEEPHPSPKSSKHDSPQKNRYYLPFNTIPRTNVIPIEYFNKKE